MFRYTSFDGETFMQILSILWIAIVIIHMLIYFLWYNRLNEEDLIKVNKKMEKRMRRFIDNF